MEIEKTKSKGTLVVIIVLSLVIVGLVGYIAYDKGVFSARKESNTKSETEVQTENKEIVITDNSLLNDLSEKVTALNLISAYSIFNGKYNDKSVVIATQDFTGKNLYNNSLTELEKLSIVLLNRNTGKDAATVEKEYLKLFGAQLTKHQTAGMCPGFMYDSKNKVYNVSSECGDIDDNYIYLYKNKFTKNSDYAYVYVNIGHSVINENLSDRFYIYDNYDLEKDSKLIDLYNGDSALFYKISESNYSKFSEYKFIFKKDNGGNYYFVNVEKVINTNNDSNIDLTSYIGTWYESKDSLNYKNPSSLTVKTIEDGSLLMNLYISRTGDFDKFGVILKDNKGSFTAITDNGLPIDEKEKPTIDGEIDFGNNSIKITIKKSNVQEIKNDTQYTFTYKK